MRHQITKIVAHVLQNHHSQTTVAGEKGVRAAILCDAVPFKLLSATRRPNPAQDTRERRGDDGAGGKRGLPHQADKVLNIC